TFCLVAVVFGWEAEDFIQNTSTNHKRIFYATLVNFKHGISPSKKTRKRREETRHIIRQEKNKEPKEKGRGNCRKSTKVT
ncbi:hypothetical protein, partial [Brevibacillus invocatus]|uniref:hypothetical protein n=1 Tax=Brevibacillus invocatus TaxID=173959 RepID=UPI0039A282EA